MPRKPSQLGRNYPLAETRHWFGFVTADRRLSIARVQIGFGLYYLLGVIMYIATKGGDSNAADVLAFLFPVAVIILVSGAAAIPLEAGLVRMPASLRAWLAERAWKEGTSKGKRNKPEASSHYWSLAGEGGTPDIAVLQLLVGVVVVPITLMFQAPKFGWHVVLIAAISEIIYLAYLGARIIKTRELAELALTDRTIEERLQSQQISESPEDVDKLAGVRKVLQARAAVLQQQLDIIIDSGG